MQRSRTWDPKLPCYGKFWQDVPGSPVRKRRTISLGICSTKSLARTRLREYLEREGVNSSQSFNQNTAPATTFGQQAERWLAALPTRRRKPVKPATIFGWRHSLDKWLLPYIGDTALAEVGNAALKSLIEKMAAAGLAQKSIVTHATVVKLVVASAVNDEGEQIYPRTWNHNFVGLPIVDPTKQHRPTVTREELHGIMAAINPRYTILVALLAGTGLRIGEALGLKVDDLTPDCRVLHVRRSVWHGREQSPKSANAVRVVDLPEQLARALREYVAGKSGYLFPTRKGTAISQRNALRALHAAGAKCGFHAFRRYRTAVLRKVRVPEDLIGIWLGHARNLTDKYAAQLKDDVEYRQVWCEQAGLGFELVHNGPQAAVSIDAVKVA